MVFCREDEALKQYDRPNLYIGKRDRNGECIFEGDILYSKFLNKKIKVENITDFLIFCGAFNERHDADIFETLEIVDNECKCGDE